uniref:IMP-specific 5'-nucleotidase 1 n=1 Tax=Dunaliella tertiolecta TaxID=3047 RepID=A0A6S8JCL5_DUNTE|mmetsp:Transcript_2259/g.5067  ORF Transcript_2259/g.5067 Transcript_2259/m.5067 type:complete len:517 (-) Transcript_2259:183-1733(-)
MAMQLSGSINVKMSTLLTPFSVPAHPSPPIMSVRDRSYRQRRQHNRQSVSTAAQQGEGLQQQQPQPPFINTRPKSRTILTDPALAEMSLSEEEIEADMASAAKTASLWELLNNPEQDGTIFGNRARSATDANVLRRKGHLKEQDFLIDFMRRMHETHSCLEVMTKMEKWVNEHRKDPLRSRLKRLVPQLGQFFTPLHLVDAFLEYDEVFKLSRRKFIPPNFAELRHVVNIAQIHASAKNLRLITFDADGTLYADGCHFEQDNAMIAHIINLLQCDIHVAIVTAAGYPGEAHKFEGRLAGLLGSFRKLNLPAEVTDRFHVMGGECNYLLRVTPEDKRLEFVPDEEWKTEEMCRWHEDDIQYMLDGAEMLLMKGAKRLELEVSVMRKPRSVGIIPISPTIYEVLEDIALSAQTQLVANVPFCAFNGGNDVFVDCGNKSLGLQALMTFLGIQPHETLHVGDRFTLSGNDSATRDMCSVLWVADPNETGFFVRLLLKDIARSSLEAQHEQTMRRKLLLDV